jgi:hypothetical protein
MMRLAALAGLLVLAPQVRAESLAVSLQASAQGGGIELTRALAPAFNARLAYHRYHSQGADPLALLGQLDSLWTDLFGITRSDNVYDFQGSQHLLSFIADWYPDPASQSHFSAGLGYNRNSEDITGLEQITGGYVLGGTHYSASQVGTLQGHVSHKGLAPYLGLGWGDPVRTGKRWGFKFDAGVIYQGRPSVTLRATGTVPAAAVEAERTRLENAASLWSPLLSMGLTYQW